MGPRKIQLRVPRRKPTANLNGIRKYFRVKTGLIPREHWIKLFHSTVAKMDAFDENLDDCLDVDMNFAWYGPSSPRNATLASITKDQPPHHSEATVETWVGRPTGQSGMKPHSSATEGSLKIAVTRAKPLAASFDAGFTVKASEHQINMSPKGWPNPDYDPQAPFPFFQHLPDRCRTSIIALACPAICPSQKWIVPYFNRGSVYLSESDEAFNIQNIDTSWLLIQNKHWRSDVTAVLYGYNHFLLRDPHVSKWWLERVGTLNLSLISTLSISLTAGRHGMHGENIAAYDELLWCKALHWLKNHQKVKRIAISFETWDKLDPRRPRWWKDQGRWREEIVLTLLGWRGLKHATIYPGSWHRKGPEWGRSVSGKTVFKAIEEAMILERGERSNTEERLKAAMKAEYKQQGLRGERYIFS